jgi:subtilisin family serine protease
MASPHVAGVAALQLAANPTASATLIKNYILSKFSFVCVANMCR